MSIERTLQTFTILGQVLHQIGPGRVRTIRPEITADRGWGSITGRVRHCVGRVTRVTQLALADGPGR